MRAFLVPGAFLIVAIIYAAFADTNDIGEAVVSGLKWALWPALFATVWAGFQKLILPSWSFVTTWLLVFLGTAIPTGLLLYYIEQVLGDFML